MHQNQKSFRRKCNDIADERSLDINLPGWLTKYCSHRHKSEKFDILIKRFFIAH
ncbi:hypothetical protein [Nostoc sp. CCY 9925]|uniref:hypothetical protein n=1 Tax=Nostoc sp. CCY 9925 TaxID=3103865 RepID=UPI0039C62203